MSFDPDAKRTTETQWSPEDYVEKMNKLGLWAVELGSTRRLSGRFLHYKTIFENYIEWQSTNDPAPYPHDDMVRILNAKLEAHEMDRVQRVFMDKPFSELKDKIRTVLAGPEHYRDEKKENVSTQKARNTLTELATGAFMTMEGHTVSYGPPNYPEPMVNNGGRNYAFQCKRLSSNNKQTIEKKIKRAGEQVWANIHDYPDLTETGVILLDITKLVNPLGMVLHLRSYEDMEFSEARFGMLDFYNYFIRDYDFKKNAHISQIIVTASFLTTPDPRRAIESYYSYKMIRNHPDVNITFTKYVPENMR